MTRREIRRTDKNILTELERFIRNLERVISNIDDGWNFISYENTDEKDFKFQIENLVKSFKNLQKSAEDIFADVIIFQKPVGMRHMKDTFHKLAIPTILEYYKFKESLPKSKEGLETWAQFIKNNQLLYLLNLISEKKYGFIKIEEANRKLLMFRHFLRFTFYFERYRIRGLRNSAKYWEEKNYIRQTWSPRVKYKYRGETHYALGTKGKEYMENNSFDPLAEKMIKVIEFMFQYK